MRAPWFLDRDQRRELIDHLARRLRLGREAELRIELERRYAGNPKFKATSTASIAGAVDALGCLGDQELLGLRYELRIEYDPFAATRSQRPEQWRDRDIVKVFLSYSGADALALKIADCLQTQGYSGFVAQYSIHEGSNWRLELERALRTMDVLVTLHTSGFSLSPWANQEIGVAFARGVRIVPVKIDEPPKGLIEHVQAVSVASPVDAEALTSRLMPRLRIDAINTDPRH